MEIFEENRGGASDRAFGTCGGGLSDSSPTLREIGQRLLGRLRGALGLEERREITQQTFDLLSETWAVRRPGSGEYRPCDITDDGSPFEFSVAFGGRRPELRVLAEAQSNASGALAQWRAGWALSAQLEQRFAVPLDRSRRIADLFAPDREERRFALWHAVSFSDAGPAFKIYFNPVARGQAFAPYAVREAFARLGMAPAWEWLSSHQLQQPASELIYFSLDLAASPTARVKVYVAHQRVTAAAIEELMSRVPRQPPGEAAAFCELMTGSRGPFAMRPVITCAAFCDGSAEPQTVTVHLPIRCYAGNDQIALDRICTQLSPSDADCYRGTVLALAERRLDSRAGIQTYISVRGEQRARRTTIYLAPEAFS